MLSPEVNKPNLKAKLYIFKFYYLKITNQLFLLNILI